VSDTQIGLLHGFGFAIFYVLMGLPIGALADRARRNLIIAAGIFTWSLMTAAGGLARNYVQLLLARIGVGIGEAALSPPAYSMIADYFPPHRLGKPIGVYSAGVYVGVGLAFIGGGALVHYFSSAPPMVLPILGEVAPWRLAFLSVGLPGILLALLMLTVKEPPRRGGAQTPEAASLAAFRAWLSQRRGALAAHMFGFAFLGMPVQAAFAWAPTFLIRRFSFNMAEAGLTLGLVALVFGGAGMLFGGWLTDRLWSRGYTDAPLRVGLLAAVGSLPFALTATLMGSATAAIALLAPLIFFVSCGIGAAPTGLQLITPNQYRARASAVFMLVLNLIATGAAPALVAVATDYLFADTAAVGKSMALVGIAAPVAAAIFLTGLGPYRQAAAGEARTSVN